MIQLTSETKLHTKWGDAKVTSRGYYQITSKKEGNNLKYLHRLVWEDWYGKSVPKGYVIHHINGNKTDNRIQNLQCVEKGIHMKFHNTGEKNGMFGAIRSDSNSPMYGKTLSEESRRKIGDAHRGKKYDLKTRMKISKQNTSTGYYRVYKHKDKSYKQGFAWEYVYPEDGKSKRLTSVDLKTLEEKVKKRGLKWEQF